MLDHIYGNEALASTQIWLLRLEKTLDSDVVSGTIQVVSLDRHDPPELEYEALSYAWGEANQSKLIDCGQHKPSSTDNLYKALMHLGHKKSRTLQIDQICINVILRATACPEKQAGTLDAGTYHGRNTSKSHRCDCVAG